MMTVPDHNLRRRFELASAGIVLLLAGGLAGWLFESHRSQPSALNDRIAIEQLVHNYILDHPEILPQAMDRLRARETKQQLARVADKVEAPFPGAVLGNRQGKVIMVEFTDYACTYCRKSVADVDALIAANPDLKIVIRELPILSPASTEAAQMALAAAEQGRYAAFHKAMFEIGHPSTETIAAAANAAGIDMDRARRTIAGPLINAEIEKNLSFARQLGFEGTPTWLIGDVLTSGAVGKQELAKAIAEARR
jgi:protein-disulfide isomerase